MDTKVENVGSVSENRKKSAATLEDHYLRKRQPQKIETGKEIIYVSTKSSLQVRKCASGYVSFANFSLFKALQAKCEKLINSDENEIIIHCLGAAIPQGILLALKICDKYPTFKSAVNTLTSELTGNKRE